MEQNLYLIKDYKTNEQLRKSFTDLALQIFGIDLEGWYQKGFWNSRYIPYSYAVGETVVANASVNLLEIIVNSKRVKALQIGTVMTHPDYRQQGLSAGLINNIIADYEDKVDVFYLFANEHVLNFYPKFGFKPVAEQQFSMKFNLGESKKAQGEIRQLDAKNAEDLQFIEHFVGRRRPVSQRFGTEQTQGIFMFYCLNVFPRDLYYLEQEDALVVYKKEGQRLDLFDLVSEHDIDLTAILAKIADEETKEVVFYYTPDYNGVEFISREFNDGLFVRTKGDIEGIYPVNLKHPMTSQA